ncbi:MAG: copper chaperone PCu(A)C [Roseobacter sp.]|jgi:copper(I)-binding protein|nr:copper chaperone PCu(A)C [Roseobacter sp.]
MPPISLRATALAVCLFVPVASLAEIVITDPYARVSRPNAPTGAAFMTIKNTADQDDRLIAARSDVAKRVELHTHIDQGDGVMKMVEIEEGIPIGAGASHAMVRGGDHVMFMGLTAPLTQGETVDVTLTFEKAGDVVLQVPVDNERKPEHGSMGHGTMNLGTMDHGATN